MIDMEKFSSKHRQVLDWVQQIKRDWPKSAPVLGAKLDDVHNRLMLHGINLREGQTPEPPSLGEQTIAALEYTAALKELATMPQLQAVPGFRENVLAEMTKFLEGFTALIQVDQTVN